MNSPEDVLLPWQVNERPHRLDRSDALAMD